MVMHLHQQQTEFDENFLMLYLLMPMQLQIVIQDIDHRINIERVLVKNLNVLNHQLVDYDQ